MKQTQIYLSQRYFGSSVLWCSPSYKPIQQQFPQDQDWTCRGRL